MRTVRVLTLELRQGSVQNWKERVNVLTWIPVSNDEHLHKQSSRAKRSRVTHTLESSPGLRVKFCASKTGLSNPTPGFSTAFQGGSSEIRLCPCVGAFMCDVCFVVCSSPLLLLVPWEGYVSWLWDFLGIFIYIVSVMYGADSCIFSAFERLWFVLPYM